MSKAIEEAIIGTTIEMSKTVAAPNADKVLGMAPAAGEEVEGDSDVDEPPAIDHASAFEHADQLFILAYMSAGGS